MASAGRPGQQTLCPPGCALSRGSRLIISAAEREAFLSIHQKDHQWIHRNVHWHDIYMTYFITNLRYVGHLSRPKCCVGRMCRCSWFTNGELSIPIWQVCLEVQGVGETQVFLSPISPKHHYPLPMISPFQGGVPLFFGQVGLVHYRLILWFFEGYIEHHRTSQICLQLFIQQQATSYWGAPSCQNHGLWESCLLDTTPYNYEPTRVLNIILWGCLNIIWFLCGLILSNRFWNSLSKILSYHYSIIYHLFLQYIIYSSNILLYFILFIYQINMVI
jgi:hypothetical protein